MGLDCEIYRRIHIPSDGLDDNDNLIQPKCHLDYNANLHNKENYKDEYFYPDYIVESLCYWRRAYNIHDYIVVKYNNGIDDMRPINLTYTNLNDMYKIFKEVYDTAVSESIDIDNMSEEDFFSSMNDKKWVKLAKEKIIGNESKCRRYVYNGVYLYQLRTYILSFEKYEKIKNDKFYDSFYYVGNW